MLAVVGGHKVKGCRVITRKHQMDVVGGRGQEDTCLDVDVHVSQ